MDTLENLIREIIPLLDTTWKEDYERINRWQKRAQKALAALEQPPAAPVTVEPIQWPLSPLICRCL